MVQGTAGGYSPEGWKETYNLRSRGWGAWEVSDVPTLSMSRTNGMPGALVLAVLGGYMVAVPWAG
jgi:hypothetical protein